MRPSGTAVDWAIRTISREAILEHLLVRHFEFTYGHMPRSAALAELNAALDRWISNGLCAAKRGLGQEYFDPVEVLNFAVGAGFEGDDPFWEENIVKTARGHILTQHGLDPASDEVPDHTDLPAAEFKARIERTYDCARAKKGSAIRLRLPQPLGDYEISNLVLSDVEPEAGAMDPATLHAKLPTHHRGLVTIGADILLREKPAVAASPSLADPERALYLKPSEGLIRVDSEIEALTAEVSGKIDDDLEKAEACFDYIVDRFRFGSVPYHAVDPARPAGWSMENGFVDCQIGAALLCAMCRSAGIPARMIAGYLLYRHDLALHYWAEVWSDDRGWMPFDLIVWQISCGGRDAKWRFLFSGAIDYRIKTEILPLHFTGASSVRLPPAWHTLSRRHGDWYETIFLDAADSELVYRDRVALIDRQ